MPPAPTPRENHPAQSGEPAPNALPASHNESAKKPHPHRGGLRRPRVRKSKPGTAPGLELHELDQMPSAPTGPARLTCIDYAPDNVQIQHVTDLDSFIATHRPAWSAVRWINVDTLSDTQVIRALAQKYMLHPLAVEDMLHVPQRPKIEPYHAEGEHQARIFLIVRMIQLVNSHLKNEQISLFLGRKTVLTFLEDVGDVWDPVRHRIQTNGSRVRINDASFLVYSLLDAIVDHGFPVLEYYGDRLDALEEAVLEHPDQDAIHQIHLTRRDLLLLRREIWPMREVIGFLLRETHECLSDVTRTYMRDVYDHTVQILEIIEMYREMATGVAETYVSAVGNRLNEVMKVLAVFASIFIPLNFLASVFGMNFKHMPLGHPWSFPIFWAACTAMAVGMLVWFRRKKWL